MSDTRQSAQTFESFVIFLITNKGTPAYVLYACSRNNYKSSTFW